VSSPFSIDKHFVQVPDSSETTEKVEEKKPDVKEDDKKDEKTKSKSDPVSDLLQSIPDIANLGALWKSCAPVELTESETEYVVTCTKHIYAKNIVFQFNVTNNMEGHLLENVQVEMESEKDAWQEEFAIPEENKLAYHSKGITFVCFTRPSKEFNSGTLACTLKFHTRDVDSNGEASSSSSEDEYSLEDVEVVESDFMKPDTLINLVSFRRQWDTLGEGSEVVKKYSLGLDNLQAGVKAVVDLLGMSPVDNSHIVAEDTPSHPLNMAGTYYGDIQVLCRAGFLLDSQKGVTLKIAVRSTDANIRNILVNCIR